MAYHNIWLNSAHLVVEKIPSGETYGEIYNELYDQIYYELIVNFVVNWPGLQGPDLLICSDFRVDFRTNFGGRHLQKS